MERFWLEFSDSRVGRTTPAGVRSNDLRVFARRLNEFIRAAVRSGESLLDCNCTGGHFGGVDSPSWSYLHATGGDYDTLPVTEHIVNWRGEQGHRVRITTTMWLAVVTHNRKGKHE